MVKKNNGKVSFLLFSIFVGKKSEMFCKLKHWLVSLWLHVLFFFIIGLINFYNMIVTILSLCVSQVSEREHL